MEGSAIPLHDFAVFAAREDTTVSESHGVDGSVMSRNAVLELVVFPAEDASV